MKKRFVPRHKTQAKAVSLAKGPRVTAKERAEFEKKMREKS